MFKGKSYFQTGYEGRCIRFAHAKKSAGVATTAYSFGMSTRERAEMARRITAALNATRHLTTDQIEAMALEVGQSTSKEPVEEKC
ncbi:hypothetical protein [Marinobacter shengliensis]|uniref:hypothetical protein n=1 Tax=Marinobacter shengliensis TaxID=1389223 RepID=UPI0011090227|nr:hypothetical protein [Marinobacter shengliensis]